MRDFNVLLTCCGRHVSERIATLRNNEDGVRVGVYACNCNAANLPYGIDIDGCFTVPPINHPDYVDAIVEICKTNGIEIIIPTVTLELQFMADHREEFGRHGIKVAISSSEAIRIANNKLRLYRRYPQYMPLTMATAEFADLLSFDASIPHSHRLCVKLTDKGGGCGFAVIDDEKARDMTLFNRYGESRYVSYAEMEEIMRGLTEPILVSEYIDGEDYSVSVLADRGRVMYEAGYVGHVMSFGAIEYGEIRSNEAASRIAAVICQELGLDGNICFDFRIDRSGKVYLLEINPRVNASLPFVAEAGINMLYLRCRQLLSEPSDRSYTIREGLKMKKYHVTKYFT